MAGLRAADLRWSRAETLRTAESRAENLSRIVGSFLSEAFAAGDASLRQLALHSRRIGGPAAPDRDWAPSLASAKAGLKSIGAISVVDRDFVIRHSTRTEIVGQSRRDQSIVRASIEAGSDDLVVGVPFPTIDRPPRLLIPIGRRLSHEDGTTSGAVVASFFPSALRDVFKTIDIGTRGTVWVFHPAGFVLFREPSAADPLGESAKNNPIFLAAMQTKGDGLVREPVAAEGPTLLSAYHTSTAPPLIVAVSLDRDEVLAEWRHEAIGSAVLFGVVALTLAVTVLVLFRQMDAKAGAELALAEAQRLEATRLRSANDQLASALEGEQQARREAETASALKDQFLMTVSHELRTPLTAIYGWSRMLVDGAVSDRQKESALRTIERNAAAQTRLIDDLLDVARAMNGQLRLDVRVVNIGHVVRNAVETVAPAAQAKSIRLDIDIDPDVGRSYADPERLQQVVWNLLSNAVKFTPSGGQVHVVVARLDTEVAITVADSGVGISPAFMPHVFERFRQEDGGTKRRYGGLGIGLAIARSLVELHGGSISVRSDGVDRGTTFMVRLPVATERPAGAVEAAPGSADRRRDLAPGRLDGARVLVVDDDVETQKLFVTILDSVGASVETARSAGDALTILRRRSFDVIVSDIEMPEVDGYAFVHHAMAIARDRGERLMAVAVTGYSRPEDEARSLASGFHSHLRKPVAPEALVSAVSSAWRHAANDTHENLETHET
jgi:signal transduction histidine kinase/ActR/RegA family two-component response regulator